MNSHVTLKKLPSIQQPLILRQKKHAFHCKWENKNKKNRCTRWPKFFLIVQLPRSGNCWKSWQPLWQLQWANVGYVSVLIGNEGGKNNHWTVSNILIFEITVWQLSLFSKDTENRSICDEKDSYSKNLGCMTKLS